MKKKQDKFFAGLEATPEKFRDRKGPRPRPRPRPQGVENLRLRPGKTGLETETV